MKVFSLLISIAFFCCINAELRAEENVNSAILSPEWTVFIRANAPEKFDKIPAELKTADGKIILPQKITAKNEKIDIAAIAGYSNEQDCAVIYNEFKCANAGNMRLGVSADWWMEIYLNGQKVFSTINSGNGSNRFLPEDHTFTCPVKAGKNLLAVKVLSGSAGWRFVYGSPASSAAVSKKPEESLKFTANSDWKIVDMSDLTVKQDSALDLSSISSENRKVSRLIISPSGKIARMENPEKQFRLFGFNGTVRFNGTSEEWKSKVDALCKASRLQGYNFIRTSFDDICLKEDNSIDPELMDKADYLLAKCRENGIYLHVILAAYGLYLKDPWGETFNRRDDNKARMLFGDDKLRASWKSGTEELLNHVNPYTGLHWKDDPVIASLEFFNEMELGLSRMGTPGKLSQEGRALCDQRFQHWLKEKYQSPESLASAWKESDIKSFENIKSPNGIKGSGLKANDFALFCNSLTRDFSLWAEDIVRTAGYKGLTSQFNAHYGLGSLAASYECSQTSIVNGYFNHPSNFSKAGSKCRQNSSVEDEASYFCTINTSNFGDRPIFVTEHNHAFWNQYQHEDGLLFAAYASLQNFDAVFIHCNPVEFQSRTNIDFSVGRSPVGRANEFLAACLFARGDVKASEQRLELAVPMEFLENSCNSTKAIASEQSRIALLCGFNISFPQLPRPKGLAQREKAKMTILPSGASEIVSSDWFNTVKADSNGKFSLTALADEMRKNGILPQANISNPANGIFQSDTMEIELRSKEKLMKLTTARSEAITLDAGKSETLRRLKILSSSVPALIAACTVDQKDLKESRRIVLIYSSDTVNSEMELSKDRVTLINLGKLPILMKTGRLEADLTLNNAAEFELYALGFDGARREKLELKHTENTLNIKIDTGALKNGPTPFFELVRK